MPALSLLISLILFAGCTGVTKYTYQEYKKIKALNEKNDSKTAEDDRDNSEGLADLEAFYKDLDSYNNFISDFRVIYDNYSGLLIELFDSFNNEQEDLDKKNQYAESIIAYMKEWLDEIKVIDTPDIMTAYHNYFQKYLENEILSYESFINGDAELSEKYQSEADDMYKNTEEELQGIRENFISKALELGIEQPFDQ